MNEFLLEISLLLGVKGKWLLFCIEFIVEVVNGKTWCNFPFVDSRNDFVFLAVFGKTLFGVFFISDILNLLLCAPNTTLAGLITNHQ